MKEILWLDNENYRTKVEEWIASGEEYIKTDKVTAIPYDWPAVELFDRAGRRIITKIKTVDFKEI